MDNKEEVVLVATAQMVNRRAEAAGINGKMNRAVKSFIKLRHRTDGTSFIQVSTLKEMFGPKFNVKDVKTIRSSFIEKGMLTIEFNEPQTNLMIREGNPSELQKLFDNLNLVRKGPEKLVTRSVSRSLNLVCQEKKLSPPNGSQRGIENVPKDNAPTQVAKKSSIGVKRARSPDLSKAEMAMIKKKLQKNDVNLKITTKPKYYDGFSPDIQTLSISGINLRRIDDRLLILKNLVVLELCNNSLSSVDALSRLQSPIKILNLAKNKIEKLNTYFFDNFYELTQLNISNNKLSLLPNSFITLSKLQTVNISRNKLKCLPYNIHLLRSLRTLVANENKLSFLPATLQRLRLAKLILTGNLTLSEKPKKVKVRGLGDRGPPTLMEISAKVLLNPPVIRSPEKAFYMLGKREDLPASVKDYLCYGKVCKRCCRLTWRYAYLSRLSVLMGPFVEEGEADSMFVTFKDVICESCFFIDYKNYPL